jgi:hypothetical protein
VAEHWHDINDPGGFSRAGKKVPEAAPVSIAEAAAESPPPKKEIEIRLLKGVWLAGENGFEFNEPCNARIEAEFLKETAKRRINVESFVRYKGNEEDLHQSLAVTLDDDGVVEFSPTLYYGTDYHQAQSQEGADPTCQYVFKATADNCVSELESELLTMPFVPDCERKRQEETGRANENASAGAGSCGKADCERCERKQQCHPSAGNCEFKETCKISDVCERQSEDAGTPEETRQETSAQNNQDAAENGSACTHDCVTCPQKDTCGT